MSESERTSFIIRPVHDLPEFSAKLLGHEKIVENLKNFVTSDNMITPLSIAIHGDWGSGKTSIMRTLENELKTLDVKVIFFEAWRYEYSNPSLGLINEILKGSIDDEKIIRILVTAANIFVKQLTGLQVGSIDDFVNVTRDAPESFSQKLKNVLEEKYGEKKLLVIIDDLDRCDVENTLQLLALLKLFLDIQNVICIAAVDFKRLEQAWHQKYGISQNFDKEIENGRNYLEKIFQLRIGIPRPLVIDVKDYLKTLLDKPSSEIIDLIGDSTKRNPRAIKKLLNLISYRGMIIINEPSRQNLDQWFAYESACIWTLLEENLGIDELIYFCDRQSNTSDGTGAKYLADLIHLHGHQWKVIKSNIEEKIPKNQFSKYQTDKMKKIFENGKKVMDKGKISNESLQEHFEILYKRTDESIQHS